MCGFPCSGKSTWAKKHNENSVIVELDWFRKVIFGHQFHPNAEPFVIGMAKSMVHMLLSQGKNVIIDATCLTFGLRQEWINIGLEYTTPKNIKIVWVKTPIESCVIRDGVRPTPIPLSVFQRMENMFRPPRKEDYFEDGIKVIEVKY